MTQVLIFVLYQMVLLFQALSDENAASYDPNDDPWAKVLIFAAVVVVAVVAFVVFRVFKNFQKTRNREMEEENAYSDKKENPTK